MITLKDNELQAVSGGFVFLIPAILALTGASIGIYGARKNQENKQ